MPAAPRARTIETHRRCAHARDRTAPAADKAAIRSDLEQTHDAYRELIGQIPDDKWGATSGNGAFTCGQLAWHIASGLDFSAGIIDAARKGKQTSVPSFLMPIGYKLNEFRIRSRSKNATRESVLADYDRDHARLLRPPRRGHRRRTRDREDELRR